MTTTHTKLGWSCEPASLPNHGLTELFLNKATAKWVEGNVTISFAFEKPTKLRGLSIAPQSPSTQDRGCGLFITTDGEPHSGHTLECGKQTDLVFQNITEVTKLELTLSCDKSVELEFLALNVAEEEPEVKPDTLTNEEKLLAALNEKLTALQKKNDKLLEQILVLTKDVNDTVRENLQLGRENEELKKKLKSYEQPE